MVHNTQYAQFHVRIHYYVVTPVMCSLELVIATCLQLVIRLVCVDGYTSIASYNKSAPGKVCNIHTTKRLLRWLQNAPCILCCVVIGQVIITIMMICDYHVSYSYVHTEAIS